MATGYHAVKDQGIQLINQGKDEQAANNYQKAYDLYCNGLQCLSHYLKYEKNAQLNKIIRAKFEEYIKTTEDLKKAISTFSGACRPLCHFFFLACCPALVRLPLNQFFSNMSLVCGRFADDLLRCSCYLCASDDPQQEADPIPALVAIILGFNLALQLPIIDAPL